MYHKSHMCNHISPYAVICIHIEIYGVLTITYIPALIDAGDIFIQKVLCDDMQCFVGFSTAQGT